ncbi:MAG: hypothetical protein Q4F88_06710 [Eubacteriales bacterium]|nr:hypothetical protein [Eubacteriales bacterium]
MDELLNLIKALPEIILKTAAVLAGLATIKNYLDKAIHWFSNRLHK